VGDKGVDFLMPEYTHSEVAEIAGRGMTKPLTRAEQKSVCASALRQAGYETGLGSLKRRAIRNKKRVAEGKMTAEEAIDDLVDLMTPEK